MQTAATRRCRHKRYGLDQFALLMRRRCRATLRNTCRSVYLNGYTCSILTSPGEIHSPPIEQRVSPFEKIKQKRIQIFWMKVKRAILSFPLPPFWSSLGFYGFRACTLKFAIKLSWSWNSYIYVYNADSVDHGIPAMPVCHLLIDRAHASLNRQLDDRGCQAPFPLPLPHPIQLSAFICSVGRRRVTYICKCNCFVRWWQVNQVIINQLSMGILARRRLRLTRDLRGTLN